MMLPPPQSSSSFSGSGILKGIVGVASGAFGFVMTKGYMIQMFTGINLFGIFGSIVGWLFNAIISGITFNHEFRIPFTNIKFGSHSSSSINTSFNKEAGKENVVLQNLYKEVEILTKKENKTPEEIIRLNQLTMPNGHIDLVKAELMQKYPQTYATTNVMHTLSKTIGWISVAFILYLIVSWIYSKYKSYVEKKKKEEYATANKVAIQDITIPMLCEYSLDNKNYFETIEAIDEGIGSTIIKKLSPSPATFNNLITKTYKKVYGLNKINNNVLSSSNVLSEATNPNVSRVGIAGRGINMLVGAAVNYLPVCRGAVLTYAANVKK